MNISFNIKDLDVDALRRAFRMTQAEYFDSVVKEIHRIPDKKELIKYNVAFIIEEPRFGAWKITQVEFKDGSYYNVGQPNQGPQKGDDSEA